MPLFEDCRAYRPDEIAVKLNTDVRTIYRRIRSLDDPLPAFRISGNGQLRVLGSDLNQYLESHRVDPLSE